MKAISLWQPWASLIACGAKPYETRDWSPPQFLLGHTIAIHAAKKIDRDAVGLAEACYYAQLPYMDEAGAARLHATLDGVPDELMGKFGRAVYPVGCVVATAVLDAAFLCGDRAEGTAVPAIKPMRRLLSRPMPDCFTVREDRFGDYAPGRWAWLLRDVKPLLPPAAVKGAQGFFDLPQGWLAG